jgi:hypothetical protein
MMKKLLFLLLIILISSTFANAQWKFGVFADPQVSWMKPDVKDVENNGIKGGINFGLVADKFFAPNYAITTGISIHSTGGNLKYTMISNVPFETTDSTYQLSNGKSVKYKLQYIDIPLGLKLRTNRIGYSTIYADLGLTAQINIKATGDISGSNITDENIRHEVNLFNLGYHIGAGIEYALGGNTSVIVGLTYTNGFVDVTTRSNDRVTLNSLALRLGIMF